MKNFRKVLALVLVVATLFSFASMASAAKVDYKDAEQLTYADAVEVLSAIGILNGYSVADGYEFRPGNPIDRDEAAKMIAVLSNAGDDVSTLYAGANTFADVAANHWAASYIAYCVQTGIVAGRNASTFDPDASVTGFEVAKMLLCVMGFDAEAQGYIGANWKVNVLRDAKNFGLLDGLNSKFDMAKAATREEVAQMMLNTLAAPIVVGTLSEDTIKISNSLYMNLDAEELEDLFDWELKDANVTEGFALVYGNVIIAIDRLVGDMYKGLISINAVDKFGRPGVAWVYENAKGHDDFVKFYAQTPDHYYTQRATLNVDLSEEINSAWPYQIVMFHNGEPVMLDADEDFGSIGAGDKDAEDEDQNAWGSTEWDEDKGKWVLTEDFEEYIASVTGKGVETFVYVDDVHRQIVIAIIDTFIDVVEVDDSSRKNKRFDLADYTSLKMSEYGTFKDGDVVLYRIGDEEDFRELDEELLEETVSVKGKNREILRVNYDVDYTDDVADVKEAESKIVKIKKTFDTHKGDDDFDKATVTDFDGKTYSYAHNVNTTITGNSNGRPMDYNDVKATYAIFFDQFGYIMYWDEPVVEYEYEYAYFVENGWRHKYSGESSYEDSGMTFFNKFVDFDAKKGELEMDLEFFLAVSQLDEQTNGRVMKYRFDEEEEAFDFEEAYYTETNLNTAEGEIARNVWGTTNTQYLVRTFDYAKCEYEYEAFEGYKALRKAYPGVICVETPGGIGAKEATVQYFLEIDEDTLEETEFASHVFIDAAYAMAAEDSFFVLGYEGTVSNSDLMPDDDKGYLVQAFREYDIYKALVGGEESYVLVSNLDEDYEVLDMGKYEEFLQVIGVSEDDKPLYVASSENGSFELVDEGIVTDIEYIYGDRAKFTMGGDVIMASLADEVEIIVITVDGDGDFDSYEVYDDVDEFNDDRYFEMGVLKMAYVEFEDLENEYDVTRMYLVVD